jgi:hypothetical protein
LFLEMLPYSVGALLVTCVSGLQEAKNRLLIKWIFPNDPLLGPLVYWILVALYVWARDELPSDAIYEVGNLQNRSLGARGIDVCAVRR